MPCRVRMWVHQAVKQRRGGGGGWRAGGGAQGHHGEGSYLASAGAGRLPRAVGKRITMSTSESKSEPQRPGPCILAARSAAERRVQEFMWDRFPFLWVMSGVEPPGHG